VSNIFDVTDPIVINNGIRRYEYYGYEPEPGTNLNTTGEIRMHVTSKDTMVHPPNNYLLVEGRPKKADRAAYAAGDNIAFINNGIMFLHDSIRRQLSDNTIDELNHPDHATTMIGLMKCSRRFTKAKGLNQQWCKDAVDELTAENQG
jgi:hypothetical protein